MKNYFLFLLLFCNALISCNDKPEEIAPPKGDLSKGIFVINEGTMNLTAGSLSFYNPDSQKVENDIFNRINKRPIGDVFQSMYLHNDKYFAVVNNMQKIEVLDSKTLKAEAVIEGMNSPRYFLPVNNVKAYVTDLYANGVWIINPLTYTKTGKIDFHADKDTALNNWTEQLVLHNNEAFVCIPRQKEMIVIDTESDKVTDTISLAAEPQWIQKDKNNNIWVLADGAIGHKNSYLYCIDPETKKILKSLAFDNRNIAVSELKINGNKDILYYIYKDIYKILIDENILPQVPVIQSNNLLFYGLGINPQNNEIYVSDAIDNIQPGVVFRYSASGELINQFPVGVSPGDFLFVK